MFRRLFAMTFLTALVCMLAIGTVAAQMPWSQQGTYDYRGGTSTYYAPAFAPASPVFSPAPGVEGTRAFYPSAPGEVAINVRVPKDAKVAFQGTWTKQRGTERQFVSPAIDPGYRYSYQVQATWTENGREVTRSRVIPVQPGDIVNVTFNRDSVGVSYSD